MQSPKDIVNAQNAGKNNYEEQKLAPHFFSIKLPRFAKSTWITISRVYDFFLGPKD